MKNPNTVKKTDMYIEQAQKNDWLLVKTEDHNCALHYLKDGIRVIAWWNKGTFGIAPKGKVTHFIRGFHSDADIQYVFEKPLEAWQNAGYKHKTIENRNRFMGVDEVTGRLSIWGIK